MTHSELHAEAPPLEAAVKEAAARPNLFLAVRRGILGRCPNCGKGHLFKSYLKQADRCASCREDYSGIRADDGPAWLTILIVGHVIVGLVLTVESQANWPAWWSMTFFPLLAAAMALLLLPVAKGVFFGAIWATKAAESKSE